MSWLEATGIMVWGTSLIFPEGILHYDVAMGGAPAWFFLKYENPFTILIRKLFMGAESGHGDLNINSRELRSSNSKYKNFPPAGKNDQPASHSGTKMQLDT